MKKMKYLSTILLIVLIAFPVFGRDFGQEKNTFSGIQYFEAGVIFGTEADSLDTIKTVSNDGTMTDADSGALVTEYAAKTYIDTENSAQDAVIAAHKDTLDTARDSIAYLEANKYESGDSPEFENTLSRNLFAHSADNRAAIGGGYGNLVIGFHGTDNIKAINSIISGNMISVTSSTANQYMGAIGYGHNIYKNRNGLTVGNNNEVNSEGCFTIGKDAAANNIYAKYYLVHSSGMIEKKGDAQYERIIISGKTTDETPTEIANGVPFPDYYIDYGMYLIHLSIIGANEYGTVVGAYDRRVILTRTDSTGYVFHSIDTIGTDIQIGGIGGIEFGLTGNYNDAFGIEVTGVAGETINWVATAHITKTAF